MNQTSELKKQILLARIEIQRSQLQHAANSVKNTFSATRSGSEGLHPAIQAILSAGIPAGIYFGSRKQVRLGDAVKLSSSLTRLVRSIIPIVNSWKRTDGRKRRLSTFARRRGRLSTFARRRGRSAEILNES